MPFIHSLFPITMFTLLLLSCLSFKATTAQTTLTTECEPNLLSLAPCAPFVQGMVASPVQPCCDNLKQLESQKPTCLCLLLNDTTLTSFPINTTLALQLPRLCNLQTDASACSGSSTGQVSFGAKPNATVAASPMVTVAPRPSVMGFGIHHSGDVRLKAQCLLLILPAILSILTNYIPC